ncbi:MAG TPA: protein kinase [Pyrinomonadaceae bacterium]|nr:protein kinase [Pyrinomonadaceae bacterium]
MLAPNTVLQNRYQVIRSIGHGGMGAVYLARDQRLGHTVALKETFFTEERMRKAFEREARLLAHLRHPALPKVTDHFDEDGGQFIVMEFISGDDLEMLLAQRGEPFPVAQVLAWGDELLKALDYLHNQDPPILHRDIKPANLKLTPQGEIILLDFGLAKGTAGQTSSVMTSRSVFGFTPNFAPLEQIQGTGTGPRSDLYSLAATLYYLMTGAIPPDALTRITEVANGQPDPLRAADDVNPQIPQAVAEILMKTLAHNRDHRPQSARELRRLLREAAPALASEGARVAETNGNALKVVDSEANTVLPSTVVEAAPTAEIPAAAETAASPTVSALKTKQPVSLLETAPGEKPAPAEHGRAKRLTWALAGVAAALMVVITYALVSSYRSDKASDADSAARVLSKDEGATAAPVSKIPPQAIAAPDNSEIVTMTDASGLRTQTRTFMKHSHVAKVVVTTAADGTRTAQVYSLAGEGRDLPQELTGSALEATGDMLASAVGFTRPVDEKGKGVAASQAGGRRATPPVKATSTKPANSKTDGLSNAPTSNPPASSKQQSVSQSNELKQTQTPLNPKTRNSTIPQKNGDPQKRAMF